MKLFLTGMKAMAVVMVLALPMVSQAFPNGLKVFKDTYGVQKGSALDKANCAICHTSAIKGDKLNPFGEDVAKVLKANNTRVLTKEMLASIEELDSDSDKCANIDEINADSLPGDAKSLPSREWATPSVAPIAEPGKVAAALAALKPRTLRADGAKVGELRVAIAGSVLAIDAKVYDHKVTAEAKEWTGAGVELAAAMPEAKTCSRLVFLPKSATGGEVQLYHNADQQAAPKCQWAVTPLKGYGYELTALIPLEVLQLDAKAAKFLFEAATTTDAGAQYTTLFGSAKGYTDSTKFGSLLVQK